MDRNSKLGFVRKELLWISPVFVMPEYRNRGLAQEAIKLAEEKHGCSDWELDTILEEKGNCYLYEKMGYRQTGEFKVINEKMTLVSYKKGTSI